MDSARFAARMVLCSQAGEVLREYPLDKPDITIGRASMRDISLPQDRLISRGHAVVRFADGTYTLSDEGSANGTLLNGKLIEAHKPYILNNGDQIHLGRLLLVFHESEDVADLPTIRRPYTPIERKLLRLDESVPRAASTPSLAAPNAVPPTEMPPAAPAKPVVPPTEMSPAVALPSMSPAALVQPTEMPLARPSAAPAMVGQPLVSAPPQAPAPSVAPVKPVAPLLQPTAPTNVLPAARLRFTLFYPQVVAASNWYALLVYAHPESAIESIYKDAALYQQDAGEVQRREPGLSSQLLRGLPITVIPDCPGVAFNPWRLTFRWQEEWHRLEMRLSARREQVDAALRGALHIFVGPLLVARLPLELLVRDPDVEIIGGDKDVSCSFYKQTYLAYSRKDVALRQASLRACRALGNAEFLTLEDLRPGPALSAQVKSAIMAADVFQLCWSEWAIHSDYVARECGFALQSGKGSDFICPIYWEVPQPALPPQLPPRRFIYLPSYTFS